MPFRWSWRPHLDVRTAFIDGHDDSGPSCVGIACQPPVGAALAFTTVKNEDVLDAGLPLEHSLYRATHAHPCPLKQSDGWSVASVGNGDHSGNRGMHEKQVENRPDRLTPEAFALR